MRKQIIAILFLAHFLMYGQHDIDKAKGISIVLIDENTSFPSWKIIQKPIHLGASISFDWRTKQKKFYNYTHVLQLGYYYHKDFHRALFLAWKPKFEWQFKNGINVHGITGVGYLHSFPTEETYKFENGSYESTTNYGRSHATISLGVGLGYAFKTKPIDVFTRYEWFSIAPYAPNDGFPFTSHTAFSLGLRIYPFK